MLSSAEGCAPNEASIMTDAAKITILFIAMSYPYPIHLLIK